MIFSPEARPVVAPARIRWEDPPCPLCGGDRRSPVLEAPDLRPGGSALRFAVVRCEECDLRFTSPRPDLATIGQFYSPGESPGQWQTAPGRVIFAHVLEQAHDPLTMLADARRSLGPGEQLIVTVPNIDSTAFGWFGPAWVGLDLPRHLTHFTPATLRRMLKHAGFRVTSLRQLPRAEWWQSSAFQAAQFDGAPLTQRALVFKPLARLAACGCYLAGKSDELTATASLS